MSKKQAHFICPACEKTGVYRPIDCDRPMPRCTACDEGVGGVTEMVWVGDEVPPVSEEKLP